MAGNRGKTMDEIMLDYLREEQDVSRREPTECLLPVITAARRARFETGGRLVFADDQDAAPDVLTALNASAWIIVSEMEGLKGFSHLIKAHDGLWLVEIGWKEEIERKGKGC
jgi:hypothetical protein